VKNEYGSYGNLIERRTYKYDDNGNEIEVVVYLPDGRIDSKWTNKFDDKGNEIEYKDYKSDGSIGNQEIYKYEFDKEGNWIELSTFRNGALEFNVEREIKYFLF
jgi:hypothetical protein